jgi:hypothetical protein
MIHKLSVDCSSRSALHIERPQTLRRLTSHALNVQRGHPTSLHHLRRAGLTVADERALLAEFEVHFGRDRPREPLLEKAGLHLVVVMAMAVF